MTAFHIFRYQILPITQEPHPFQIQFEPDILSLEELKSRKNAFFLDTLQKIETFEFHRTEIIHQILDIENDIIVIRMGARRGITRSKRDFTEEKIENWPNILVILNNDPDIQLAAIEVDRKVFYRTTTTVNLLEQNLNRLLAQYQLHVRFNATFQKARFWDIVEKYQNRIIQTEFVMISPNLSNISKSLSLDLSELHARTNTQETHLQLNSDENSSLKLSRNDGFISGLVDYTSEGGGNIIIKVKGLRKRIQTEQSVREFEIDEAELVGAGSQELVSLFRDILRDERIP